MESDKIRKSAGRRKFGLHGGIFKTLQTHSVTFIRGASFGGTHFVSHPSTLFRRESHQLSVSSPSLAGGRNLLSDSQPRLVQLFISRTYCATMFEVPEAKRYIISH